MDQCSEGGHATDSKGEMCERAGKENETAGCVDAMSSVSSDDLCLVFC